MLFRYHYACEATFQDDPAKAMSAAREFKPIFEAYPHVLPKNGGAECYLMIAQMGIDPIVFLLQISMEMREEMMDPFYVLVKRFHIGLRTWVCLCQAAQVQEEISLEFSEEFNCWQESGIYRNDSDYFQRDLELAGIKPKPIEGE